MSLSWRAAPRLHPILSEDVWAQDFDIDTERLPLGQLSQEQVQRGYDVLERLRAALAGNGGSLERLSSEFYQVRAAGAIDSALGVGT